MLGALGTSSLRTFATVIFAVFGFLGLSIWGEYSSWQAQVSRIEADLAQTSKALVQHADDTIDMAKFPLAALITQIDQDRYDPGMSIKLAQVMRRQVDTTPWLETLSVVDASGAMVASSSSAHVASANFADRPYFRFHQSSITRQPIIGAPVKSRLSGQWIIPVTQRINDPDGGFAGIALAGIPVGGFVKFFAGFRQWNDGSFVLLMGDGTVLTREPFAEDFMNANLSGSDLFKVYLRQAQQGAYHYTSPVDRMQRIGGFYQSPYTGLVGLAAASQSEALAAWMKSAQWRWASGIVVFAITGVLAWRWRGQVLLRRRGEVLLLAREAEFRLLAEGSSDVIQRFNGAGTREYLSPSSREIFGVEAEAMIGTNILDNLHEDDRASVMQVMERLKAGSPRESLTVRRWRADGRLVWLETRLNRLPGGTTDADIRMVAVTRDVTRQKKIQEELDQLANTDELTQLANRRSFNTHFEDMLARAERERAPISLLMIDADRFKLFNDTYGHAAGDDCLRAISSVVLGCIRRSKDLAARYGGEEIAVILPDTDADGALKVAENIRMRVMGLKVPHEKNLPWGQATISIGKATLDLAELGMVSAGDLFALADQALYHAKNAGRNQVVSAEDDGVMATVVIGAS